MEDYEMDYADYDKRIKSKKKKKKMGGVERKKETIPEKPPEGCSLTPCRARCESKKRSPAIHSCHEIKCPFIKK